jgi:hypothetical protein
MWKEEPSILVSALNVSVVRIESVKVPSRGTEKLNGRKGKVAR